MAASTPLSQMTPRARPIFPPPSTDASSTIRPILRKPGSSILGVRKRSLDEDDGRDDDDTVVALSSPIKKRKTVMFNENLNVVKRIGGRKTVDEAKRDIMLALDGHDRHDSEDYDRIKELFAPQSRRGSGALEAAEADDETEDALAYVVALTGLAKRVDRKYPGLVKSVLRCAWLERDDNFARAYIQLMAALSTAHGSIFAQVLSMMVDKFVKAPPARVPGFDPVSPETKKERLHLGLRYLLELFPAGGRIVLNLVESKFPYTEEPKAVHMTYIDHLLQLKNDRPDLERDIMELILSRLVKLDVEMTLDLENEGDDTTRAVMRQMAAAEKLDDDGESDAESVVSDDNDEDDDETRRVTLIKSKLETMDATMDLLFSIYTPIFETPDSELALATFQDLLSDFSNVILPNLKSRHTQYLLFKFAMKSHRLMDLFIGTLFNLAFESNRSPAVKQAAVGYLASFTARGAQLSSEQVQTIAETFLNYIDHYRATHASCRGPDVRRYGQYYAYFQGLLYIFCFRWRDLIDRESAPASLDWEDTASFIGLELPWVPWLKSRLQANIASKLNPLKCCSPIIVEEFARLSHHLRLLYIYPQIEKNKNVQLSQFFTNSYATGGALRDSGVEYDDEKWTHLEACFPFDPFQLPVSKRWLDLDKTYISWQRFAILDRDDDTDAEVETDAEIDDETGDEGDDSEDEEDDKVSIQEDTTTDEGGER